MCQVHAVPDIDPAEAFAERMVTALNEAALMLMTSVGHRTGLLDAMADGEPVTSDALAARTGLSERYVREWLAAMGTGAVLEIDPEGPRYRLPHAHAAWLTRGAGADNLALYAQYIGVFGAVEDDVVECFHRGGGVPYARFTRFHEVMAEDSGLTVVANLFDHVLPLVDGLERRLEEGVRVLDLGCGRGRALLTLAERFPRSTFTGWDLSDEAIAHGAAEASARGLRNLTLEVRDLSTFAEDAPRAAFDLVTTFDAVHDQPAPGRLLSGIRRALAPGGVYVMQDIQASSHVHENRDHPFGAFLYTVSCMHCMTVSLAQGGEGLGTMWGEQTARRLLAEAGFEDVRWTTMDHDPMNAWVVCRP